MTKDADPRDRELLNALQSEVPLISTPFAVIGQMIEMSEKEVLKRADRLRREGFLRQISGVFDARALGYRSCLVAGKVAEERIDHAASVVNLHPGVTQNYRRNHDYNLWFTISIAPDSKLGLEGTLEILGEQAQWSICRPLPTLRSFKNGSDNANEEGAPEAPLSAEEIEIVKLMQRDLPLVPRPFDAMAKATGIAAEEILSAARTLARRGQLKKMTAIVQARKSTFSASAMGVWAVPQERVDEIGTLFGGHKSVTQCFLRPTYDDWPYNIYTTVHGRSVDECESLLSDIAEEAQVADRRVLFPVKEYKRARLHLFGPDIAQWETSRGGELRQASAS